MNVPQPKIMIPLAGFFIALLGGIAFLIFRGVPNGNFPDIPPVQESTVNNPSSKQKPVYPYTDSSSCAMGGPEKVADCCGKWATEQSGLTIPKDCKIRWTISNDKQCIYSCETSAAPI